MSTPAGGQPGRPETASAAPAAGHRRPWGWIVACLVLVLLAVGLAVWAVGLNSDLDDQRDQTAEAQQQADQATQQVESLSGQVDEIEQTVSDASDQLSQAGDDAEQTQETAQTALDDLKSKVGSVKEEIQEGVAKAGTGDDGNAP